MRCKIRGAIGNTVRIIINCSPIGSTEGKRKTYNFNYIYIYDELLINCCIVNALCHKNALSRLIFCYCALFSNDDLWHLLVVHVQRIRKSIEWIQNFVQNKYRGNKWNKYGVLFGWKCCQNIYLLLCMELTIR